MQNDNGSQTINFDSLASSIFHQKFIFNQHYLQQGKNTVKNQSHISEQIVKTQENSCWPKRSKNIWTIEEQCQYFYAAIKFSIDNPYFTISWKYWKPLRFYNYLEDHMSRIFGKDKGRTIKQCKTKDQNLKIRYSKSKCNDGEEVDLIDISINRLNNYISQAKEKRGNQIQISHNELQKVNRYEDIINTYRRFEEMRPKDYSFLLQNLRDHSLTVKEQIKKVKSVPPS